MSLAQLLAAPSEQKATECDTASPARLVPLLGGSDPSSAERPCASEAFEGCFIWLKERIAWCPGRLLNELLVAAAEVERAALCFQQQIRSQLQDEAVPAALVPKMAQQLRGRCGAYVMA